MNIRTVANPILPADVKRVTASRDVKSENSSEERDADGRRQPNEEPNKNPLSEEEMKKAKDYLDQLPSLKANGLTIEVSQAGEHKVFLIRNADGLVVRRIVEWEMRALITDKDKKVGQIFDKSA